MVWLGSRFSDFDLQRGQAPKAKPKEPKEPKPQAPKAEVKAKAAPKAEAKAEPAATSGASGGKCTSQISERPGSISSELIW
jgi:hypothetical protein